ncbi:MAG: deoxyguanosinetriphosphate triphosphohydrolase [Oscillospiraceae bacterium]|jgi:dGTPase|nr:deoxyguanosinetriphosphate triphosphohydrolase [Oscillospiraceae bacterium]
MTVREITTENETRALSKYARKSADCEGRDVAEPECPVRTDFQRDRDRIIHCSAFRRLKHKTQVFLFPKSEHYRTRLTHTLEVAQIARTVSRALKLNEDLTEAIALGHDLGHTPFGHEGERVLDSLYSGGFRHYEQSVRVVEVIERDGRGLNLTREVRDGILNHSGKMKARTLEGDVVRLSDKIAYINHDIEDAARGGVLNPKDLPEGAVAVLGDSKSKRITSLIVSIINNSGDVIRYDERTRKAHDELRDFMFEKVYFNDAINAEKEKVALVIEFLYGYYKKKPENMPKLYRELARVYGTERAACDYISGMTDDYAVDRFTELCVPKAWRSVDG